MNLLMLGGVYATSPLFRGTAPEIAAMAVIAATHAVVLGLVARRLRGLADKCRVELEELAALTA